MAIQQFDAPAKLTEDLTNPQLKQAWSDTVSGFVDDGKAFAKLFLHSSPVQFYNELTDPKSEADRTELPIIWQGFPRLIEVQHGEGTPAAFKAGEGRGTQDEYLEWHVTRDGATNKIKRIEFTCEGPEYWQFLAQQDPDLVVARYQKYVSPDVQKADLFQGGAYQARNKWNSSLGAMHLTQVNNTLGAEVNIAAAATILRKDDNGQPITEAVALINCARYGVADRASDPHIGSEVNRLARDGFSITLRNPIGLYIDSVDLSGIRKPDGSSITQAYFRVLRGGPGETLRAVFETPAGETAGGQTFVAGDLKLGSANLTFGGQIAKRIKMRLTGVAVEKGSIPNKIFPCGDPPPSPLFAGAAVKSFASRAYSGKA